MSCYSKRKFSYITDIRKPKIFHIKKKWNLIPGPCRGRTVNGGCLQGHFLRTSAGLLGFVGVLRPHGLALRLPLWISLNMCPLIGSLSSGFPQWLAVQSIENQGSWKPLIQTCRSKKGILGHFVQILACFFDVNFILLKCVWIELNIEERKQA